MASNLIPSNVNVIPEKTNVPSEGLSGERAAEYSKQYGLASKSIGGDYLQARQEAMDAARANSLDILSESFKALEVADRQYMEQKALAGLVQDPETNAEILAGAMLRAAELAPKDSAIEDRAVQEVSKNVTPVQQAILDRQKNSYEKVQDNNRRRLIWQNFISRIQEKEDQEGFIEEIPDFIKAFGVEGFEKRFGIGFSDFSERLKEAVLQIENSPTDQLPATLKQFEEELMGMQFLTENPQLVADLVQLGAFGTEEEFVNEAVFDALDFTLIKPTTVVKGIKGARNALVGSAKASGDESQVIDDILEENVENTVVLNTSDEQVKSTMNLRDIEDEFPTFSQAYQKRLNQNEEILQRSIDNSVAPEFTREIAERHLKELELDTSVDSIVRIDPIPEDAMYRVDIGDFHGRPFVTKELAESHANKLGFDDAKIYELPEGGFLVRKRWSVDEVGPMEGAKVSPIGFWINNVDNFISPQLVREARQAEGASTAIFEAVDEVFKKSLLPILSNRKAKVSFHKAIKQGIDEKRWLKPHEFINNWNKVSKTPAGEKELAAYKAFKQLNDYDWVLKNNVKWRRKNAQGLKTYDVKNPDGSTVSLDAKPALGDEITEVEAGTLKNNSHVFVLNDVTKGADNVSFTASPGDLQGARLESLLDSHQLVKMDKEGVNTLFANGPMRQPAEYALIPRDVLSRELKRNQVSYAGGGRRVLKGGFFVKAARSGKYNDGSTFRLQDKALFNADTRKQAKDMAENLDAAIKAAQSATRTGALKEGDDLIQKLSLSHIGIQTVDDVVQYVTSKGLMDDILDDVPNIQGLGDREIVDLGKSKFSVDANDDAFYANAGNSMDSYRGEIIPHVDGQAADSIDPILSLARNLDRSANMQGFDAFRERALESLRTKYSNYIDHDPTGNPLNLMTANAIEGTPAEIAMKIRAEQKYIQEIFRHQTPDQGYWQQKVEKGLDFIFDKASGTEASLNKLGGWWKGTRFADNTRTNVRAGLNETLTNDPAGRVKSLVFNAKLGMFNPASFIMQAQQGLVVSTIVGKEGWRAAMQAMPARMAMHLDDEAIQTMAVKAEKMGFDSADDFIDYVREFKTHGFNYLGKNIAYIDGVSGAQFGTTKLSRVADWSRGFFNEGERATRLTAYGAARNKWKGNVGGINPKGLASNSVEGRKYIQSETHRLMYGMTRADIQFAFRGKKSIPTQFLSYPFRAVAAMLPKSVGGRAFTAQEKKRMILAYGSLYGAAGIPVANQVQEYWASKYGDQVDPTTMKFLSNGIIDGLIFAASEGEMDTNFAGRAGLGQFTTDVVKNITDPSALEFVSGAAGKTGIGALDAVNDTLRMYSVWTDPSLEGVTDAALSLMVDQVTSLSNAYKAYLGWNSQMLYDQYGRRFGKVSKGEIAAMIAGLPPQTYEDAGRFFLSSQDRKQIIKDSAQDIINLQRKYHEAYKNNDSEAQEFYAQAMKLRGVYYARNGLTFEVFDAVRKSQGNQDLLSWQLQEAQKRHMGTPVEGNSQVPLDVVKRQEGKK